jgi:hypothetical protein
MEPAAKKQRVEPAAAGTTEFKVPSAFQMAPEPVIPLFARAGGVGFMFAMSGFGGSRGLGRSEARGHS